MPERTGPFLRMYRRMFRRVDKAPSCRETRQSHAIDRHQGGVMKRMMPVAFAALLAAVPALADEKSWNGSMNSNAFVDPVFPSCSARRTTPRSR